MKKLVFSIALIFLVTLSCGCVNSEPRLESTVSEECSETVSSGGEYVLESGRTLYVNGKLICESGARIVVEKGANLLVNGELEISGELQLDGFIGVSDSASVYGEGFVKVNSFNDIMCDGKFTATIVPPPPVTENGVTSVGGIIIVNKKIPISAEYGSGMDRDAVAALNRMRKASGYEMKLISGFRDYEAQRVVFENWCSVDGVEAAEKYSSRPGHSEHQTGFTIDITQTEQDYAYTDEGRWVAENCYKYGYIVRYPEGKEDVTGYIYEPWHLRYLGRSVAKLVHDSGLTLEEFLGVEG